MPSSARALAGPYVRIRGLLRSAGRAIAVNPLVALAAAVLVAMLLIAVFAPYLGTIDPLKVVPAERLRPPSAAHWLGTDNFGRDLYSRAIYGSRVSLLVGVIVASLTTIVGTFIGLIAGFVRLMDAILLRVMDALMAIPAVLLAIALVSILGGGIVNVILAISIADLPRMVRLVRGVVLSLRERPYVEAAIASGTRRPQILLRHILPNVVSPIIVQSTFICASAILVEASLGFLGVGTPPEIPSWGNIIAGGRAYFLIAPGTIIFPGLFLLVTILAINVVGDGLRDFLDPRSVQRR